MAEHTNAGANPAVVGLAGFGFTTLILQFHNLGLCEVGPVLACGLIFGGLAQFIAGLHEFKMGNNFGYSAFVAYGSFWIAFCIILLMNTFGIYESSTTDIGYFLVGWTLYTAIMWVGAMRINTGMSMIFTLLLLGFILLDFSHLGYPAMTKPAAIVLIFCALSAWYVMAASVFEQVFGRSVLPLGKPWIGRK